MARRPPRLTKAQRDLAATTASYVAARRPVVDRDDAREAREAQERREALKRRAARARTRSTERARDLPGDTIPVSKLPTPPKRATTTRYAPPPKREEPLKRPRQPRKYPVLTDLAKAQGMTTKEAKDFAGYWGPLVALPASVRHKTYTKESNKIIAELKANAKEFSQTRRRMKLIDYATAKEEKEAAGQAARDRATFFGIHTGFGPFIEAGRTVGMLGENIGRKVGAEVGDVTRETLEAITRAPQSPQTKAGPLATSTPLGGLVPLGQALEPGVGRGATLTSGVAKALAAGGAAIAGAPRHPIRTLEEGWTILKGTTQGAALAVYLLSQPIPDKQKRALIEDLVQASLEDLQGRYGSDVSFKEALQKGYDEPVISFLNALAIVAPAAKGASILRAMRGGASLRQAIRISRDPMLAEELGLDYGTPRTLTIRGEHVTPDEGPRTVEIQGSRSPVTRAIGRGLYDPLSKGVEKVRIPLPRGRSVRGRGLPISETKRALRAERQNLRRTTRRLTAEGVALYHDVLSYVGGDSAKAARLFHGLEKPADVPEEVWLKALADDIGEMLGGREVITPDSISAAEKKLINRVARFKKEADVAARNRWLRRVDNVATEQERLRTSIVALNEDIRETRRAIREVGDDPDLTPEEKQFMVEGHEDELEELHLQRRALKNDLEPLEAGQLSVSHARRDEVIATLGQLQRVTSEEAEDVVALLDARARSWATQTGRDAGEWYDDPDGFGVTEWRFIEDAADLPEGALAQRRIEREVHNDHHGRLVKDLVAAEVHWDATKKKYPEKDADGNVIEENKAIRKESKDALALAVEEELYARLLYRSQTYRSDGNFPRKPGRSSLAANLVEKYAGRKSALPPNAKTPEELEFLFSLLDELATEGEHGRLWYENSATAIKKLAGGDKKLAANIAQLVAIFSPQKAVIPNMGEALKAYHSWLLGEPITNGQKWQIEAATNVLEGLGDWDGRKTNNFYLNFLEDIDNARYKKERILTDAEQKKAVADGKLWKGADHIGEVTVDMWMARVFGYKLKGVTEGRYDVIESMISELARERGWKPKQMQAAIWTAIKAASDDVSANVDFADAIARHDGVISYAPEPDAGPFAAVWKTMSTDAQVAYSTALNKLVGEFLAETGVLARAVEHGPTVTDGEVTPLTSVTMVSAGARLPKYSIPENDARIYRFVAAAIGRATQRNEIAWNRTFIALAKQDAETAVVKLNRRATEDQMKALWYRLNPTGVERVTVSHLGTKGVVLRRVPGTDPDWPNFATGKKYADSFAGQVDAAVSDILRKEHVMFRREGETLRNDWENGSADYDEALRRALGDGGGTDRVARLGESADRLAVATDRLRRDFLDDPDGAGERHGLRDARVRDAGRDDLVPTEGPAPERVLAQTRDSDLKGAVAYLNSEDGRRIVYLTQKADVSTLMHELVGHSTREIARSYPTEFAAVERYFGKPLEEWDVDDHERFADMFERYLADGRGPIPELVMPMKRMKTSIRAIYGGLKEMNEGPLPPEVAIMFDTYFGAFDDAQVFRVAQLSTKIPEDLKVSQAGTLFDFTSRELAALRRRNETRAYNKSLEALEKKILEFEDRPWESLDAEEQDRLSTLYGEWQLLKAQQEMTKADRESGLRRRLANIEDAMALDPDDSQFKSALASLQHLTTMREDILHNVFGGKYDAVFGNRVDLFADWLVDQGHLAPEFERGTAHYAPHMPEGGGKSGARPIATPARGLDTSTIGRVDTSKLQLNRRNNMIRWQQGDIHADPLVVFEAWQTAQSFAFIHELKKRMWDIGEDVKWDTSLLDKDVYLINFDGIPVPELQRRAQNPASTADAQQILDALDARDPGAIESTLKDYAADVLMKPEDLAKILEANPDFNPFTLNLRMVDKQIIDGLFRPLRGAGTKGGQAWDITTGMARWALIYTNPAYVPINLIGNLFFLFAQQPIGAIPNLIRALRMGMEDERLWGMVGGEVGELPAFAAISRGRRGSKRVREAEAKALNVYTTIPDKWPRIAAWIYEARRMGYKTPAQMKALMNDTSPRAVRAKNTLSHRATEVMVNFDRLTDFEKNWATRVLFIWPWIRGATAWPFYFAKEFPGRTAVAANLSLQLEQRRQEMLGNVASYREDLFPVSKRGSNMATVINASSISPGSTAADQLGILIALMKGLEGENADAGQRLIDLASPMIQALADLTTGTDTFGRPQSALTALWTNALSFIPFGSTGAQLLGFQSPSKIYKDQSKGGIIARKLIRIDPEEVSIARLQAFQTQEKKSLEDKITDATSSVLKAARKVGFQGPLPGSVTRAIAQQQAYLEAKDQRRDEVKDLPGYKEVKGQPLTPLQEANLSYAMVKRYAPAMADAIPSPDYIPDEGLEDYARWILYGSKENGIQGLFQPLEDFRAEIRKVKEGSE